jgi:cytochrome c-type biogenesis protein CcmF
VFILMIFAVFMGGALTLFALRGRDGGEGRVFHVSRESALVLNNVLLAVSSFVVFIGTIWPLVAEMAFDRKLSVGPPFFNAAFTPFMVALAVMLPVGAMLPWKRGRSGPALRRCGGAGAAGGGAGGAGLALQTGRSALGPVGLALGLWVVLGALADLWQRTGRGAWRAVCARLARLPRADWGKATAHSGLGVTVFAVAACWAGRPRISASCRSAKASSMAATPSP